MKKNSFPPQNVTLLFFPIFSLKCFSREDAKSSHSLFIYI